MTQGIRILALVGDAWGGRGGIAQYNRDLLGAWAQAAGVHSIEVLPRQAPDLADPPRGVRQRRARPGRAAYVGAALWAALSRPVDLVFCGHLYMVPLAALVARLRGARLVVQTHGIEAWERPSRLRRLSVEAANLVLSVSRYTRGRVLGWASIPPERARVIPNTVDEAFSPGDGSAFRASLGLVGKRLLLTVGRMDSRERYKGHDRVIVALRSLVAAGHDVVYVVSGEGDDQGRLCQLAEGEGVAERVRFVGALSHERLIEAYRTADLFVMPSTGEGFGITFVEALACGAPVLGLDVAGARDALADGVLGRMVQQSDDLAAALGDMLSGTRGVPAQASMAVAGRLGRAVFTDRANALLGVCAG